MHDICVLEGASFTIHLHTMYHMQVALSKANTRNKLYIHNPLNIILCLLPIMYIFSTSCLQLTQLVLMYCMMLSGIV